MFIVIDPGVEFLSLDDVPKVLSVSWGKNIISYFRSVSDSVEGIQSINDKPVEAQNIIDLPVVAQSIEAQSVIDLLIVAQNNTGSPIVAEPFQQCQVVTSCYIN